MYFIFRFLSRFLMLYHVTTSLKYEELVIKFGMTLHIKQRPMLKIHLRSEKTAYAGENVEENC